MHLSLDQVLAAHQTPYPLRALTKLDLKGLCKALWTWEKRCPNCPDADGEDPNVCPRYYCPWGRRFEVLATFFEYYRQETRGYLPHSHGGGSQALRNNQDLADIITLLRTSSAAKTREQCMEEYFASRTQNQPSAIPLVDQERAFVLAAKIITMVAVNLPTHRDAITTVALSREDLRRELPDCRWLKSQSLQVAILDAFPPHGEKVNLGTIKPTLTATNLIRLAKLQIKGTNDLRCHLQLDPKSGKVWIFHHTVFMKEHLTTTRPKQGQSTTSHAAAPCLPRDLLLETLYTLHLLFPLEDDECQKLLRELTVTEKFDPDCLIYGTSTYENDDEVPRVVQFPIWGARLNDLYNEIHSPTPRTMMETWTERHSNPRYTMMVTLIGIAITVLVAIFTLILSIFQAVVAWLQYRQQMSQSGAQTGH
ncbi:hypothetical protein OQA88_1251 [Cercophora sp. LCS_1]